MDVAASVTLLGTWRATVAGAEVTVPAAYQRIVALLGLSGRLSRPYLAGTLWGDLDDVRAGPAPPALDPVAAAGSGPPADRGHGHRPAPRPRSRRGRGPGHRHGPRPDRRRPRGRPRRGAGAAVRAGPARRLVRRLGRARAGADQPGPGPRPGGPGDRLTAGRHVGAAIEAGFAAIRADPLRESAHRIVIRAHLAEGNPASALRQYDRYRRLLHSQLGLDHPSPDMVALVESIG